MINMPGGPEMVVILLVALMVLGPKELPKVMRTVGNVMAEVRKVSAGFQNEIRGAMDSFTAEEAAKETVKPQSGTMTSVIQPTTDAEPSAEDSDSSRSEVIVRNTETTEPSSAPAGDDASTGAATSSPGDAADRASG